MKHPSNNPIGNASYLKRLNRSTLLHQLRRNGGLSRKQLTQQTGLDGKTITNASNDLLEWGMLKAIGTVSRGVGRPSEILELNPNYGYAIGVDVGAGRIAGAVVDFTGAIVARSERRIHYGVRPKTIIQRILSVGAELRESQNGKRRLLGVGVCVPGTVDREAGVGVWAANLKNWRNVVLRSPLENAFNTPLFFEESTRCAALGEMFARVRENLKDFLLLDLSLGVGSAIVQDGRLYYGHSGIAGEIGHTTVKPNGFPCRCGKTGCLETEASGYAIARKLSEFHPNGSKATKSKNKTEALTAKDAAEFAMQGDERCSEIFSDAGRMLGSAAANAVMLLNPAHLILMGGLTQSGDLLLRPFRETLRRELTSELLENMEVEISPLGNDGGPLGAASMPLSKIYDTPDTM